MKISVILPTYRKNNRQELDNLNKIYCESKSSHTDLPMEFRNLAVDDLHDVDHILSPTLSSLSYQKFTDFELILCHKHPEDIKDLVKDFSDFIDIKIVKEKLSIWHSLGDYATVNNNRNTGIIYSRGELLFFLDDMTIFNKNLLQTIWNNYMEGFYTTCKVVKRIKLQDNKIVGNSKMKNISEGDVIPNTMTWSYGMSVSSKECFKINGFDEIWDGSFGGTDMDFGRRLNRITKYKRKAGPIIYEFAHYTEQDKRKKIRDDEAIRQLCKQSPIPQIVRANSWKPTEEEQREYVNWHLKNIGELDLNWNQFTNVPFINLKELNDNERRSN